MYSLYFNSRKEKEILFNWNNWRFEIQSGHRSSLGPTALLQMHLHSRFGDGALHGAFIQAIDMSPNAAYVKYRTSDTVSRIGWHISSFVALEIASSPCAHLSSFADCLPLELVGHFFLRSVQPQCQSGSDENSHHVQANVRIQALKLKLLSIALPTVMYRNQVSTWLCFKHVPVDTVPLG